jgi:hypothetical protein
MPQTEVISLRLPRGTVIKLKLLACQRSLEQQREVRWASIVKDAIEKVLTKEKACKGE